MLVTDGLRRIRAYSAQPRDGSHRATLWVWLAALALFALWLAPSLPVRAGARFERSPAGWQAASANEEASTRARAWAEALDAELSGVFAPRADDEFQETLALLDMPGPMPGEAPPGELLQQVFGPAVDDLGEPTEVAVVQPDSVAPPIVRGRFETDGIAYHVAVAASGDEHTVIVLAIRADEESLYSAVFEESLDGLEGVAASPQSFDRRTWWAGVVLGWLVLTAITWFSASALSPTAAPMAQGRRVAALCVALAVVAGLVAWFALGKSSDSLLRAGSSREWAVVEVALVGLGAAVTVMVIAAVRQSRVRPIQSAPSGGAFAERPARPNVPFLPGGPPTPPPQPDFVPAGAPDQPIMLDHTEIAPTARYEPVPLDGALPDEPAQATQVAPAPVRPSNEETQVAAAPRRPADQAGGDHTQVAPRPAPPLQQPGALSRPPIGPATPRARTGPHRTAPISLRGSDADHKHPGPAGGGPGKWSAKQAKLDRTLIGTGPPPKPEPKSAEDDDDDDNRGSGSGGGFPPPM